MFQIWIVESFQWQWSKLKHSGCTVLAESAQIKLDFHTILWSNDWIHKISMKRLLTLSIKIKDPGRKFALNQTSLLHAVNQELFNWIKLHRLVSNKPLLPKDHIWYSEVLTKITQNKRIYLLKMSLISTKVASRMPIKTSGSNIPTSFTINKASWFQNFQIIYQPNWNSITLKISWYIQDVGDCIFTIWIMTNSFCIQNYLVINTKIFTLK